MLDAAATAPITFSWFEITVTIVTCAFTALLANMALAVFNDGVRPFLYDFIRGNTKRMEMTSISFGLSAGFIFGLGAPLAFSTGLFNPWLLFLPTDILGIFAPRRWLAPLLGAAWGGVVTFGLGAANSAAQALPVDFLTAMQSMATPILFLFALFPAIAISQQFGRLRGALAFVVTILVMVVTVRFVPSIFPGAFAMAAGVLLLIGFAVTKDLRARRREATGADGNPDTASEESSGTAGDGAATSLFGANAERLRRHVPLFMGLGALIAVLANLHVFGGGEATSFVLAKGNVAEAAQLDFYRAFGFVPLIATTALASGAYGVAGFTFVYPLGYLAPNVVVAAIGGAVLFAIEVFALSYVGKGLAKLPSIRDASDYIRSAITQSLEVAILFGALLAGNEMAGGLGIAMVGGLYLVNEALGRPVIRLASGPTALIISGVVLNILYWLNLFTPAKGG